MSRQVKDFTRESFSRKPRPPARSSLYRLGAIILCTVTG